MEEKVFHNSWYQSNILYTYIKISKNRYLDSVIQCFLHIDGEIDYPVDLYLAEKFANKEKYTFSIST